MLALRRAAALVLVLGAFWVLAVASYEWEGWLARGVSAWSGPLELKFVNATSSPMPVVSIGASGSHCFTTCLEPGERFSCKPHIRGDSQVLVRVGTGHGLLGLVGAPYVTAPVNVTWRSHGTVTVVMTDGGIEVEGALSEQLP